MYIHVTVATVVFVFLSILVVLGARDRAVADSSCLEQPGPDGLQGEHWYYHYDQQKNRKCWHLGANNPVVTVAPAVPPPRTERPRASLSSVFSPLIRSVRNLFRRPIPRHEATAGEPRIVQSDPTRPLTIEDITQQPDFPEERAEPRPVTVLTAAQRRALYDEYMKWESLQRNGIPTPVH